VLKQNHFEYNEIGVLDTVMMGHKEMWEIAQEKNAIYMNPDATDADGLRAADLENTYGEMGGWTAESDAAELLSHMGVKEDTHYKLMKDLSGPQKVKVLLAQALFGNPDILMLDEPTNDLDAETATWLADFLADFPNLVIVISHDRYFLDMVCTHIVDIDFKKIKIYRGNYTFWYESSQLAAQQQANKNKKTEQKRKEMLEFIQRFSANASKSKQATSRKKALEKLSLEDIQPSTRKYPFINFKPERAVGDQILKVDNLSKVDHNGDVLFSNVSFTMNRGEKISLFSRESAAITAFYDVLSGKTEATTGTIEFGQTITKAYLPNENEEFFSNENDQELMDWLRMFSENKDEQFIPKVMLAHPNFLLMDEPTNHLDLESITALNNAMRDFPGNMIFTTHDHQIISTVGNRIIEISPNGIIDTLMDFEDYIKSDKIKQQKAKLYGEKVMA